MKRTLSLVVAMTVLFSSFARADQGPNEKFWRGVVNVITAPIEIPKQTRAYWIVGAQKAGPHISAWVFCGAVWGIVETIKRAGSGVWDIVSSPINKPEGFEPLMKPDYVFDQWPRNPKTGL